jgi:hypothetical protein
MVSGFKPPLPRAYVIQWQILDFRDRQIKSVINFVNQLEFLP